MLFIGTRLITHAPSCVHSASALCKRSLEKEEKFSYSPVLSGPLPQLECVSAHPSLKANYFQPWGPSHLLLRPSDLIPSKYLTHTSGSKNSYTAPSSAPSHATPWAVCSTLPLIICFFCPPPSSPLSLRRARVTSPPLHSSKVPFALA